MTLATRPVDPTPAPAAPIGASAADPVSPPGGAPTRLHILKAGTFTDMHGQRVHFTAADLAALAAGYDPALQRAPLVVGHPRHNSPAFGWIKGLVAQGDDLEAEVEQLDPAFVSAVRAGRYATRSASLYPPGHAGNPKPGAWYLRHLGFLGGQPPAVKGLRGADLADGDDPALCLLTLAAADPADPLADPTTTALGWVQGLFSPDDPPAADGDPADPAPVTASLTPPEDPLMPDHAPAGAPAATPDPAALTALSEELATKAADLAAREASLAAREQAAAAQAEALRRTELTAFCDELASQARIRPADVKPLVALLASLPETAALDFAAADDAATALPPAAFLRRFLGELPPLVALGEIATGDRARPGPVPTSDASIARRAQAYKARQDAAGNPISFTEAVAAVELDLTTAPGQER